MLFPDRKKTIERAAWLSKTDLITGVVGEFPELQGLMGSYYALNDGEDREVAEAILQQYLPAHSGDRLPETDGGAILSLADKIDNVVSFFAIGLTPTGSEDPFALRRQALAVIATLMEKGYAITLEKMIAKAVEKAPGARPSLPSEVIAFFIQRMEPLLSSQGHEPDIIQSVIHFVRNLPLREIKDRIQAVKRFTSDTEYAGFLLAMKRINNIVPGEALPALNPGLLSEPQEKILWEEMLTLRPAVQRLIGEKKYYDALKLSSTLTRFINSFFDGVLVMDKRDEVKLNRFALLREIWSITSPVADVSRLRESR
jgi:glycyl-tRNA synthetase beta chain